MMPKILPREDPDAAKVVSDSIAHDGVTFVTNVKFTRVEFDAATDGGLPVLRVIAEHEGVEKTFASEVLLVATGRRANVDGLGLEEAGVEFTRHGVTINDTMQTSNPDIYAVGDVATPYQFTHVAGTMAQMVVQNALFGGDQGKLRKMSELVIPWVTYTEPEIAHVGITESGAKTKGIELDT
jgi:pyruvate/2-oxoglutarate dehydrogenase complex dihydrolipoamide dehydrogenase (E3) component